MWCPEKYGKILRDSNISKRDEVLSCTLHKTGFHPSIFQGILQKFSKQVFCSKTLEQVLLPANVCALYGCQKMFNRNVCKAFAHAPACLAKLRGVGRFPAKI